jgi:UDP-glucose 4-epimerase
MGDEYGICSEEAYSLLDVAHMFGCKIKMLPATKTSRSDSVFNTDKIKKLGWKQAKTLKEYIKSAKINKK